MNDEIKTQLMEMLKTGIDFAKAEIPQVIREYLVYHFWEASLWFMVGSGLVGLGFYFSKKFKEWENNNRDGFGWAIAAFMVITIGAPLALYSLNEAVKIKIAPRVYLIDAVREGSGRGK